MATSTISATVKQSIEIINDDNLSTLSKPTQTLSSNARKRTRKPAKPRWRRVLSVLMKNLTLVILVAGLVKLVMKLGVEEKENEGVFGFEDIERRVVELEEVLKTMAKMVEVEVESVGRRVESEVEGLRWEIIRRVEGNGGEIDGFEAKREGLETGLRELREVSRGFVSKDDVVRLYDELVRSGSDGNGKKSELSLDDVRVLAREVVEREIEKHVADGLGRVDYALASGGARVEMHSEALVVGRGVWFGGVLSRGVHETAVRMLSPSFGEPGMCFSLKGSSGFVQIRLRNAISPEAITLEHVAKTVAHDQSSAPKYCHVFGWIQGQQDLELDSIVVVERVLLTEFTFDLEKSNAQTFNVFDSALSAIIDTVRFEFNSNHGSPTHTCLYRIRVHGHDPRP